MDESDDDPTTEQLNRRASLSPRLVLAALAVGLIAGGIFLTRFSPSGEGPIDPELLRLLERVPFDNEGNLIEYLDLEMARQGPIRDWEPDSGPPTPVPEAFGWSPQLPQEGIASLQYPIEFEQDFGYRFEDINQTLLFQGEQFGTFVVLDDDASAALDRATTPSWAPQEVRSQVGPFDILDWGDGVSVDDRTDLRPMGELGQLTAFDGNVILRTVSRARLDPVLATEDGATSLADRAQLLAALALLNDEDSLGFSALFQPDDSFDDGDTARFLPLIVVETGLHGSSRLVLGFRPGADLDQIEANLRTLIDPTAALIVEGSAPITRTFTRQDDFIVIDVTSSDVDDPFRPNSDLRLLFQNIFRLNPELLS